MPRVLKKPWLDSYLDYVDETDKQIPVNYNIWTGISLLGASLKGNIYCYYRGIQFFPNQYVILIGPPGIGKGSAMRPGIDLAKEAGTVNYIEDQVTPEQLIAKLSEGQLKTVPQIGNPLQGALIQDHTACAVSTELPNFLGAHEKMHSLLCDLWDRRDYTYDTKNKGHYKIEELCFSLLSGCTPDYIRSLIKDNKAHITGGFTARTIFAYASEVRQLMSRAFGKPKLFRQQLFKDLVNDLQYISNLSGEVEFTDEAQDFWEKKYIEHNTPVNGSYHSDAYQNFKSRISSHILKTSLAICVSEADNLRVTRDQLERATKYIEGIGSTVDIVFKYIGERPIEVAMEKVADFIKSKGFASRHEILRYNRQITDEELSIILKTLELAERIEQELDSKGKITFRSLI